MDAKRRISIHHALISTGGLKKTILCQTDTYKSRFTVIDSLIEFLELIVIKAPDTSKLSLILSIYIIIVHAIVHATKRLSLLRDRPQTRN